MTGLFKITLYGGLYSFGFVKGGEFLALHARTYENWWIGLFFVILSLGWPFFLTHFAARDLVREFSRYLGCAKPTQKEDGDRGPNDVDSTDDDRARNEG
jgi:hypothetical protein